MNHLLAWRLEKPSRQSFGWTEPMSHQGCRPSHGCCWPTFYMLAYCGLVGNPNLAVFVFSPLPTSTKIHTVLKRLQVACYIHLRGSGSDESIEASALVLHIPYLWLSTKSVWFFWVTCPDEYIHSKVIEGLSLRDIVEFTSVIERERTQRHLPTLPFKSCKLWLCQASKYQSFGSMSSPLIGVPSPKWSTYPHGLHPCSLYCKGESFVGIEPPRRTTHGPQTATR